MLHGWPACNTTMETSCKEHHPKTPHFNSNIQVSFLQQYFIHTHQKGGINWGWYINTHSNGHIHGR